VALPPESHRLRPDHLPTPFSATQIRDGSPRGRHIRVRVDHPDQDTTYRQIRLVEADDGGAVHEFQATDADGRPTGDPVKRRSTWIELQGHASQPADQTTLEEADRLLAWGTERCWLYVVRQDDCTEARYWFAQAHPGMPMVVEDWRGDDLLERNEVISDEVDD
jgi:hypothetical protein